MMQQQSDSAQQAQSKSALLNQKQQGDIQLEDKKIAGRIATQTIKQTHKPPSNPPSIAPRASRTHRRRAADAGSQFFAPSRRLG